MPVISMLDWGDRDFIPALAKAVQQNILTYVLVIMVHQRCNYTRKESSSKGTAAFLMRQAPAAAVAGGAR
jgi:hypothetical protein